MARKNYAITEACIRAFEAQGRGEGEGADYLSWLTIRDVPSLGRSHRSYGIKTNRVHHTLSDGEHNTLLALEADPRTRDIREQFPMNRLGTYRAARDLGLQPSLTPQGTPYVMTIDFLVVQQAERGAVLRPLTFKYSYDPLTQRELELLAIASLYWKRKGLHLEIIDESFYDRDVVMKYSQIRTFYRIENLRGIDDALIVRIARDLGRAIVLQPTLSLSNYCDQAYRRVGTAGCVVLDVFRHLLARRVLLTDLRGPPRLEQYTLSQFSFPAQS